MIVKAYKGDLAQLFKQDKFDAIAHGCNIYNTMGRGIALDIKNQFPRAYEADCQTTSGDRGKMGQFTAVHTSSGMIYNAYTQATYWNPRDMFSEEALTEVMFRIDASMGRMGYKTLGLPCIGAGLAKGDWNRIVQIIEDQTQNIDVHVVVWDKEKDPVLLNWLDNFNR